jgi:hypothetical protein
MRGLSTAFPFTEVHVGAAPRSQGVYILFESDVPIYIGLARGLGATIRSRLQRLLCDEDPSTRAATHYQWAIADDPATAEAELLADCKQRFGCLPRCDEEFHQAKQIEPLRHTQHKSVGGRGTET